MNVTAISSVTKQSEPVYSTNQALNVNLAGQAAAAGGTASIPIQTTSGTLTPKGYQQITATTTSFTLTPPAGSRIAVIQAEAQSIRYRDDGIAPTATVGMLLNVGEAIEYDGNLAAWHGIAATAGAILNVSYYA